MKCGLVCCYKMYNYGGTLQSYALQVFLGSMGTETEMIDYDTDMWNKVKRLFLNLSIIKVRAVRLKYCSKPVIINRDAIEDVRAKFREYQKRYITSGHTSGMRELRNLSNRYDVVMIGSDQMWQPNGIYSEYNSLEFVLPGIKKVSYSTSLGIGSVPKRYHRRYRKFLSDFDSIAVRESTGKEFLERILERDVKLVMDPVFLLKKDRWIMEENAPGRFPDKYILIYGIGEIERFKNIAVKIADDRNAEIIIIPNIRLGDDIQKPQWGENIWSVGPAEFLWLIHHAEFIITDSFHGTAFSVIYEKQFFTILRYQNESDKESTNTRLYSLLERMGLLNRIVFPDINKIDGIQSINYTIVNKRKEREIQDSIKYLESIFDENN